MPVVDDPAVGGLLDEDLRLPPPKEHQKKHEGQGQGHEQVGIVEEVMHASDARSHDAGRLPI